MLLLRKLLEIWLDKRIDLWEGDMDLEKKFSKVNEGTLPEESIFRAVWSGKVITE